MKKKLLLMTLVAALLMAVLAVVAYAAPRVRLDGRYVDVTPVIVDGRTLLPARNVVEMLGGEVGWDGELRQVTIIHGNTNVLLTIDNPTAYVNGNVTVLDVPPQIINDSTKIPLRFVAEALGVEVDFVDGVIVIAAAMQGAPVAVPAPTPEPVPSAPPTPEPISISSPTPISEPAQNATGVDLQRTVWLPQTRNDIYHSINDCGRMNPDRATAITREQAHRRVYRACERCW
ncbi:MAG: stalk domain-containing protein [Defluviitaleaceae bacterium]|nr:stalk domain-containing protein [Defluviitaleaceae bacterium]